MNSGLIDSPSCRWKVATGFWIKAGPSAWDGYIFAASGDGVLYCIDASTGTVIWKTELDGAVASCSPARFCEYLVIGSTAGTVYLIDWKSGAIVWTYATGASIDSSCIVSGEDVFFGTSDGNVIAISITRRERRWSLKTAGDVSIAPATDGTRLIVGSDDFSLYCLNNDNGDMNWCHRTDFWVRSSAIIADGNVFAADWTEMICLCLKTGNVKWKSQSCEYGEIVSSPSLCNGLLYYGDTKGGFYCLDASRGSEMWRYNCNDSIVGSPAVSGSYVYFGSYDNYVYCLDRLAGTINWRFDAGNAVATSIGFSRHAILFGCDNDIVYCLNDPTQLCDNWPMFRGNARGTSVAFDH